jgi:transposase-like protein
MEDIMNNRKYDWELMAHQLDYASAVDMWRDLYEEKVLSTAAIARKFGVSQNTVRTELMAANIPFRSRGGPNNTKIAMTEELMQSIKERGMTTVAKELGLKYGTLYKRYVKYQGLTLREEARLQQAGQDAPVRQDKLGENDHAENR